MTYETSSAGHVHYRQLMADYLRRTRVLGIPIQFALVTVITVAVVIYLSGWAAFSSSEARANVYKNTTLVGATQPTRETAYNSDIEKYTWERIALFVCPLH